MASAAPFVKVTSTLASPQIPLPLGGINLKDPCHAIKDNEAVILNDFWTHNADMLQSRGPLPANLANWPADFVSGVVQTKDPAGIVRAAIVHGVLGGSTLNFRVFTTSLANFAADIPLTLSAMLVNLNWVVTSTPFLGGGTLVTIMDDYSAPTETFAFLWRGSNKQATNVGTITAAVGSATVTGGATSWLTTVEPGMFVYGNVASHSGNFLGVVQSVGSNTSITLDRPSPYAAAATGLFITPIRPIQPNLYLKGRLTCSTNTTAVTGANTKWKSQPVGTAPSSLWDLFRLSDGAFIGAISSITTDTGLVLTANAAVNMQDELFYAKNRNTDPCDLTQSGWYGQSGGTSGRGFGALSANWQKVQWYANAPASTAVTPKIGFPNRLWFSSPYNGEAVDQAPDGDFIDIVSADGTTSPIVALVPTYAALLVFTLQETWAITGTSPANFKPQRISSDGILGSNMAVGYQSGAMWCGRKGVYSYMGGQIQNLVAGSFGNFWAKNSGNGGITSAFAGCVFVYRDYLFVCPRNFNWSATESPNQYLLEPQSQYPGHSFAIYLPDRSVSTITNAFWRGALVFPTPFGSNFNDGVLIGNSSSETTAYGTDPANYFKNGVASNDQVAITGNAGFNAVGPSAYIRSKAFSMGSDTRRKTWKQVLMEADCAIALNLRYQTGVIGWGAGTTAATQFAATTFGTPKSSRVKFVQRDRHLTIRVYGTLPTQNNAVNIYDWTIGFKWNRLGRP